MKIKKVLIQPWKAKLKTPFTIATGSHSSLDNLLLIIELEDGTKGYGEACIAKHITGETVTNTRQTIHKISRVLKNRQVTEYIELFLEVEKIAKNNHCALAAFEMAMLDAFTRLMNEPFWKIFGSRVKKMQSDMTIVMGSVSEAEKAAVKIKRDGFKTIKLKVGNNIGEDIKRIQAIHAIYPRAKLVIDANQGFTVKNSLKFLDKLKAINIKPALFEQPVRKSNLKGLVLLSQKTNVPICADESASSVKDVYKLINLGFKGVVNIKFVKFGIQRAWEAVQLCKKNKIKLMIGVMMESPIATMAAAHFAAGVGEFDFIDLDSSFFMSEQITKGYRVSKNGVFDLKNIKAGLGVMPR